MNNATERDDGHLFAGLDPPPPPADLRARAVEVARHTMGRTPAPDSLSRIWNNRGIRLAWAATVVLLLAGHVLVGGIRAPAVTAHPPIIAEGQRDEQLIDLLRPVAIDAAAHPTIGRFADAADLSRIEHGGNPS